MKKLVPFRKELEFNTEVAEITSISLEHTLQKIEENFISGDLVLTGEYKIVDVSLNTEKFDFKLPFDINIDNHYDTKNLVIDIDDFMKVKLICARILSAEPVEKSDKLLRFTLQVGSETRQIL